MIVVRAPLRLSFVGGGTDMAAFYQRRPGRVVSTTIDKFVYLAVNRTPLVPKVSARYKVSETVDHPKDLQHTRIKAALLDQGIERGIEIGSFAALPAETGLGSSSAFSVALVKALGAYQGNSLTQIEAAEAASRLEIELVGEPIGKQDQYAAAFGGINVFQFNPDESVDVQPVLMSYEKRLALERHVLLFFTGISRPVAPILSEQRENVEQRFETLCEMADSVPEFAKRLLAGDFRGIGHMLHEGWMRKRTLASLVSTSVIDELYSAGLEQGAWGGKVAGAGGGGCLLFIVLPERRAHVQKALEDTAAKLDLADAVEVPVKFTQSGTEILFSGDHHHLEHA